VLLGLQQQQQQQQQQMEVVLQLHLKPLATLQVP
jgi:hypothetical protein